MKRLLLISIGIIISCFAYGQIPLAAPVLGGNVLKINISSSLAVSHYMFQYERALGMNRSVGIGIGTSSGIELPFKDFLLDQFGENVDAERAIESTRFDKLTITPEYRFYTSAKGAPIGFYIATFARYTRLSFEQNYYFTPSNGEERFAVVKGELNGYGAGAMLGVQYALGKVFTLDWWIVGPFAGVQSGEFNGVCDMSDMTAEDLKNMEADIEDVDIPLWNVDATVGGNKIDAKIPGLFLGVRLMGLCLGFRF